MVFVDMEKNAFILMKVTFQDLLDQRDRPIQIIILLFQFRVEKEAALEVFMVVGAQCQVFRIKKWNLKMIRFKK